MTILRILIFVALLIPSQIMAATPADNVVALVGGIPITSFELQRQINRVLPLKVSFHGGVSAEKIAEIQKEALKELVERAYKVKYAIDHEISVKSGVADEQIETVRKRFKTKAEFEKALGEETLTELKASLNRQLLADEAEKTAVTSKVAASEDEIRAYYSENKQTFFMPKQYRASHILIRVDPASNAAEREQLKKKAEELLERAKQGEDFFDLAYYNSDDRTKFVGGDLGMFHEGQTEKPFENALKEMKVGDISDVVSTRFGFHIIKLTQINEPRQLGYDEMQSKIKTRLEKERHDKLYSAWIEDLKQKYKVETFVE